MLRSRVRILLALCVALLLVGWWLWGGLALVAKQGLGHELPRSLHKDWRAFMKVNKDFGFARLVLVGLWAPKGKSVLSADGVRLSRKLLESVEGLPGVERVLGLANTLSVSKKGGAMVVRKLFPADGMLFKGKLARLSVRQKKRLRKELASLRTRVLGDPLLRGSLVSADGRVSLLLCFLKRGKQAQTVETLLGLLKGADKQAKAARLRIFVSGMPAVAVLLPRALQREARWLLPLCLGILLLFFWFVWRSWFGLLWMFLVTTLASGLSLSFFLLFNQHLQVWAAKKLNVGVILIPLVACCVVSWWSLQIASWARPSSYDAWSAIRKRRIALLTAGMAFALGMGMLLTSGLPGLVHVGWFCGLTALIASGTAWFFFPRNEDEEAARAHAPQLTSPLVGSAGETSVNPLVFLWRTRKRRFTLLVALVVLCAGGLFLRVERSLQSLMPSFGRLALGEKAQRRHLGGELPLFVRFRGDLRDPFVLKAMHRLGLRLSTMDGISQPQSLAVLLSQLNSLLNRTPRIPDKRSQIAYLWSFLDGRPELKSLLREGGKDGILQARVRLDTVRRPLWLLKRIDNALERLPLRYRTLSYAKADKKGRHAARKWRVDWILEGVQLWGRRFVGRALSYRESRKMRDALERTLQAIIAKRPPQKLKAKRWREVLMRYLSSEECDLELKPARQAKVLRALASLNRRGVALDKKTLRKALVAALRGSAAAKDREGLRYGLRSLVQLAHREHRRQQRLDLMRLALQGLARETRQSVAALGKSLSPRALLALEGEFAEIHNAAWIQLGAGRTHAHVVHTGMHKPLLRNSKLGQQLVIFSLVVWFLGAFLALAVFARSPVVALRAVLPLGFALVPLFGLFGWLGIPFDLLHGLCLLLAFSFVLFPATMLAVDSSPQEARHTARSVLWFGGLFAVLWTPLLFSLFPIVRHTGWVIGGAIGLGVLSCVALHPWLSATPAPEEHA